MKKIKLLLIFIIILILLFIFFYLVRHNKIHINKFFISKDMIVGVDLSSYQGTVNMEKLKEQNISFVYIKATEGSSSRDRYFYDNWDNAWDVDLLVGAYHFFSYDSEGKSQAKNYITVVGNNIKGRLIPAVDVEYYDNKASNPPLKEDVVRELKDFLDVLEDTYEVKPIIYTRPDIYYKYLKGEFDEYKKWISSLYYPLSFDYRDDWDIWQYTNKGLLDGYRGREKYIDLNVLNKKKNLNDLIVK